MTSLAFVQVDAFADRPFAGNPAAVMPLDAWLDDEMLQAIALENNLARPLHSFPPANGEADYELRWFTPTMEVVLCGHATLASGHVLIGDAPSAVRFRTRKAGVLEVARDGDGYAMSLPAWSAEPKPLPRGRRRRSAASAVETLWHAEPLRAGRARDEAEVRALAPDFRALAGAGRHPHHRHRAGQRRPTSSAASSRPAPVSTRIRSPARRMRCCVPYWAERLGRNELTAYQASTRGGHLTGRLAGDRVILGGQCVTVIEGVMRI